jgi:hypothetical protein
MRASSKHFSTTSMPMPLKVAAADADAKWDLVRVLGQRVALPGSGDTNVDHAITRGIRALFDEFVEETHAHAGASFGAVGVLAGEEGRPSDVQVDVGVVVKRARNLPAVWLRPRSLPRFLMSATSLLISSPYSSQKGKRAKRSNTALPGLSSLLELGIRRGAHGHGAVGADGAQRPHR